MTCCTSSHVPIVIFIPLLGTCLFDRTNKCFFGFPNSEAVTATPQTEGAETLQALSERRVGEAVNETVAEAVADSQPCGEKRGCRVVVYPSTLQQEVQDVGQPEDVEHTGNAKQYHSVSLVWVRRLLILQIGRAHV